MIEQITADDIRIGLRAENWEDAIRKAAQPLLDGGKIEERYIGAMIDAVRRVGPYIVIGRHVALAHARPECGVREAAVCFATLCPPVPFGSGLFDPVSLVITLAATSSDSHLELLSELAGILMEEDNIDALIGSRTPEEFLAALQGAAEE